ncbi:MAG: T9SS type A sorting domain-containing protein [Bacteroidota bacterium]
MNRLFSHIALLCTALSCLVLCPSIAYGQQSPFRPLVPSLTPTAFGSSAVADFDADGDLDMFLTGIAADGSVMPVYYRNDGVQNQGLAQFWVFTGTTYDDMFFLQATLAVGDFENDNDADVVISGDGRSVLLLNDGQGRFTRSSLALPGFTHSGGVSQYIATNAAAWGDLNNDGFSDLILTGEDENRTFAPVLLLNEGGRFATQSVALDPIIAGQVALEDIDNDQDLDVVALSRPNVSQTGHTPDLSIWYNNGGTFEARLTSIPGLEVGNFSLGDYDNDGRVDLLLSGTSHATAIAGAASTIYLNEPTGFRFHRTYDADALFGTWFDFDHDGFLDVLLSFDDRDAVIDASNTFGESLADSLGFAEQLQFQGVTFGAVQVADFDGDAQMDLFATGLQTNGTVLPSAVFYHNRNPHRNQRPEAPTNLTSRMEGGRMHFAWDPATDAETPSTGLTYNLRVGTTPGGSDILSPLAREDGRRLVSQRGNVGSNTAWYLDGLSPNRTYYWSVQALDVNHIGSAFAEEFTPSRVVNEAQDTPTAFALTDVYPNPFGDVLRVTVESTAADIVRLSLYDALGRQVTAPAQHRLSGGRQTIVLDDTGLATLAPGVYHVRAVTDQGVLHRAVMHF